MRETFFSVSASIRKRRPTRKALFFALVLLNVAAALGTGALFATSGVFAQDALGGATWRDATEGDSNESSPTNSSDASNDVGSDGASADFRGPQNTRYSLELSQLPNKDGQFWVVYDLAPYAERFPNVDEPQNAIVDRILADSGEEFWRGEPFSVLSATRERLYVYHCAKVQQYVSNVVDRFLDQQKKDVAFSVRIVALQSGDWRARLGLSLNSLATTTSGSGSDVQSWLVERAELDKIFADCQKRADCNFLNAGRDVVKNGATSGWAAASPQKSYVVDYRPDPRRPAGYATFSRTVDEGFRIETTPLLSTTGETLELTFRFRSTVVEKTKTYSIKVPTSTAPRRQLTAERPVVLSSDFRGKVALARSKAAIIDLGILPIATPKKSAQSDLIDSISEAVGAGTSFCDVLIFVEEYLDAK